MPHIPNHPSAQKRHRQSLKRQTRNRAIKTRVRSVAKQTLDALEANDKEAAAKSLREAMKVLQKAASKGTLKRNTAARKIARLSRRFHRKHGAQAAASS
ncbi:MAG TPA: 30S ribosomal protein S20 [Candidatus Binataceae bacterium]|nr:30S ribosomal protein S20 [Candidatus Binataceae bacterium]